MGGHPSCNHASPVPIRAIPYLESAAVTREARLKSLPISNLKASKNLPGHSPPSGVHCQWVHNDVNGAQLHIVCMGCSGAMSRAQRASASLSLE